MEALKLPLISFRSPTGLALFPGISYSIDIGRAFSLAAIKAAVDNGNRVIVAFQKRPETNEPRLNDLWDTAVEATITKTAQGKTAGSTKVFLSVLRRLSLRSVEGQGGGFVCVAEPIEAETSEVTEHMKKLAMTLQGMAQQLDGTRSFKPRAEPRGSNEFEALLNVLANAINVKIEERVKLLRCTDPVKRLEQLHVVLSRLTEEENERVAEEERKKSSKRPAVVQGAPGKSNEFDRLAIAIAECGMPDEARKISEEALSQLRNTPPQSSEFATQKNYLNLMVELPWNKSSDDKLDIPEAQQILDDDHYGLEEPKDRILEFLSVRKLAPEEQGGMILCLVGPPGVGKTSLGKSVARSTGREFVRLSLGGVRDEAEIRGHRRTYVGAMPGRIIQEIKRLGVNTPVFMLDEVDKIGNDFRGDPSAALLEVLDPEQNFAFRDNYIGTGFDLSKVMFIVTANDASRIDLPLTDRMDVVNIPGYSSFDKMKIAKRHLVDKQKKKNGLAEAGIEFGDDSLACIIESYTGEAGVRELERKIGSVLRKIARDVASEKEPPKKVNASLVRKLLKHPIIQKKKLEAPTVGVSTGLAASSIGGTILMIESLVIPGLSSFTINQTGSLGDVLQESVKVSLAWIRANAEKLGIDPKEMKRKGIHIHFPAGAMPKDGPSAGVAITTALVSLLTGRPVRDDVAMTGEISLRGRVMPVGGVVEKALAARRAGIKEVILPKENEDLLQDIPKEVVSEMNFTLVEDIQEALKLALVPENGAEDEEITSIDIDLEDLEAK